MNKCTALTFVTKVWKLQRKVIWSGCNYNGIVCKQLHKVINNCQDANVGVLFNKLVAIFGMTVIIMGF